MAQKDLYRATADLIANAVRTAKILGESPRIARLVASSIGRFAAELDDDRGADAGDELLAFALESIDEDAAHVPSLYGALAVLADARG